MLGLQEWIHKFEEGEGVRYVKVGVALLALLALGTGYNLREFKNFSSPESMDTAQLARNLAEGRGYSTQYIRPFSIYLLQRQSDTGIPVLKNEHHPDLANAPLYPAVLAGLMKVLPFNYDVHLPFTVLSTYQPEMLIAIFNQGWLLGSVILLFRLALRLFDAAVAWLSAVALAGADLFWRFSVSGLSTLLLVFLFLAVAWCLVVMEQRQRENRGSRPWFCLMAALTGLLTGLMGLARYSCILLILPVAAYMLAFLGQRRAVTAITAGISLLIVVPWIARNYSLTRTPFGIAGYALYQQTEPFPGTRLEKFLSGDFEVERGKVAPSDFVKKLVVNGADILRGDLPRLGGSWLAGFFLVSLLVPFKNPALGRLRWFICGALAVFFVCQALGKTHLSEASPDVNGENLLVLLAPLTFMFGAGLFFVLIEQLDVSFPPLRAAAVLAFAGFISLPMIFTLLPPRAFPAAWPPYWPPRIQEVGRWLSPTELMMSDMPWAVAWYGDRKCVWTTLDAPSDQTDANAVDFYAIYDHQRTISALYLTTLTTDMRFNSDVLWAKEGAWGRFVLESLWDKSIPKGFPLKQSRPGFIQDGQLFLTDRVRWPLSGSR